MCPNALATTLLPRRGLQIGVWPGPDMWPRSCLPRHLPGQHQASGTLGGEGPRVQDLQAALPPLQQPTARDWPCHVAKPAPCERKCGRELPCGNHTCARDCHKVRHAQDMVMAGINCKKCEAECEVVRPPGCPHPCRPPPCTCQP